MPVTQQVPVTTFTANGATVDFSFSFKVLREQDLRVSVAGLLKTLNVDYTVTGVGVEAGGSVTFAVAPAYGAEVIVYRQTEIARPEDYQTAGDLPAATLNLDYDRLWMAIQELLAGLFGDIPQPGSAIALLSRLQNAASNQDGAGIIAYNGGLAYPANTVGAALQAISGGNFLQGGTGAVSRTMQNKVRESISIADYGASPSASAATNDAAIAAAITYARSVGKAVFIPGGNYAISAQIVVTGWVHIFGEGREKSVLTYNGSTLTGSNGVLQFNLNTGARFVKLHDFGLVPGTGTATNGLRAVLATGGYMSNSDITDLYIGDFTSYGISLDNTVGNGDGFFTTRVARCWITNGFQGIKIGDSMFVEHNTITIGTLTRTMAGVLITGLSGARNCTVSHNNITCAGGAMVLIDCEQYTIENNQCEHPFYYSVDYLGAYNAFVYGYNIKWCRFVNNTFQTGAASIAGPGYTVLLEGTTNYCKFNSFERCKFYKGETAHINYGVGAVFNSAPEQKNTWDSSATYVISDATYPNYEVELPLSLVNSWTTHSLSNAPTIYFEESGWATVRGFVSNASPGAPGDGSIAVLPLLVNVANGRHRFITQANGSDSSNSIIQAYSGKIWAITAPTTSLTGLDGVRFKYSLTIPE